MRQSSAPNGGISHLKHIPLAYDMNDSEGSARNLLFALKPEWKESDGAVEFIKYKEGITNNLFKAIKRRPGLSEQEIDAEAVMLRAYGNGTAILIDREREAQSHFLLAKHNLAPPLLARFDNGLLYGYIEGVACSPEDMRSDKIWSSTARLLGQWHGTIPVTGTHDSSILQNEAYRNINSRVPGAPTPNIWTVMQRWIIALPVSTNTERDRQQRLQGELEHSAKLFGRTKGLNNGEYAMGHCDLLSGNIIILPNSDSVSFIDYEYTTPCPAAFDLANHFAEWGGFACDYSVLPTRSQRRAFITEYVNGYRAHKSTTASPKAVEVSSSTTNSHATSSSEADDVEQLSQEVDDCRGLPGLYWGIWALIQATISQIDFDYASYAEVRLAEYWDWKAEVDGSREQQGKDLPVREARLAQE